MSSVATRILSAIDALILLIVPAQSFNFYKTCFIHKMVQFLESDKNIFITSKKMKIPYTSHKLIIITITIIIITEQAAQWEHFLQQVTETVVSRVKQVISSLCSLLSQEEVSGVLFQFEASHFKKNIDI